LIRLGIISVALFILVWIFLLKFVDVEKGQAERFKWRNDVEACGRWCRWQTVIAFVGEKGPNRSSDEALFTIREVYQSSCLLKNKGSAIGLKAW